MMVALPAAAGADFCHAFAMKIALRTASALVLALAAGCASNPKDRYEAPPDDGSANANSADVVTEPPITPR